MGYVKEVCLCLVQRCLFSRGGSRATGGGVGGSAGFSSGPGHGASYHEHADGGEMLFTRWRFDRRLYQWYP